jgi:ATP/ADP translocase
LFWLESTITGKAIESGSTGLMVIFLSLFIGTTAVAKFGWTKTALATPVLLAIFGTPFLAVQLGYSSTLLDMLDELSALKKAKESLSALKDNENYSLVLPVYLFGFLTVIFAKSFKYAFASLTR